MKTNQFIKESTEVDEAQPMGMLSRLGNKLASKVPFAPNMRAQASGKLETGALANQTMTQYKRYLGQNGEKPSDESVLAFLKAKGFPTAKAQQVMATLPGFRKLTAPTGTQVGTADQVPAARTAAQVPTGTPAPPNYTAPGTPIQNEGAVHTVDLMRSYLSILSESTVLSEATPLNDAQISQLIKAAVEEYAATQALAPQNPPATSPQTASTGTGSTGLDAVANNTSDAQDQMNTPGSEASAVAQAVASIEKQYPNNKSMLRNIANVLITKYPY